MVVCPKVPYRTLTVRPSPKLLNVVPIRTLTQTHTCVLTTWSVLGIEFLHDSPNKHGAIGLLQGKIGPVVLHRSYH